MKILTSIPSGHFFHDKPILKITYTTGPEYNSLSLDGSGNVAYYPCGVQTGFLLSEQAFEALRPRNALVYIGPMEGK